MREENYGEINAMADYEYEEDKVDTDFVEHEAKDDFDYDGYRMHKYDGYEGELTVEIALVKYETLVRHLARKYEGRGAEYDELVQIGFIELSKLVAENKGHPFMSNFLQRRLGRYISYSANKIRQDSDWDNKVSGAYLETKCDTEPPCDWIARERQMFLKVATLLCKQEMELLQLAYSGKTRRQLAAAFGVSHTVINRRIEKIRLKLLPLKPWLEMMSSFECAYDM